MVNYIISHFAATGLLLKPEKFLSSRSPPASSQSVHRTGFGGFLEAMRGAESRGTCIVGPGARGSERVAVDLRTTDEEREVDVETKTPPPPTRLRSWTEVS